jgi:hypothetical protein
MYNAVESKRKSVLFSDFRTKTPVPKTDINRPGSFGHSELFRNRGSCMFHLKKVKKKYANISNADDIDDGDNIDNG